jgi:hypothetical protein
MSVYQQPRPRSHTFAFAIIAIALIASSCSDSNTPLVESAPAYQPSPAAPQIKMPALVTPKLAEVQEAVRRVFKDSAVIDSSSNPSFFTGDFNGDSSQDLAVILRPAPGKVAEMNQEYPMWLLRDPFTGSRNERPALTVEQRDVLLAIIHGYGDNDWRDSQATQTFLLKNAVGSNITVATGKEFLSTHSGRKLPRPQGDLIRETLRGTNGYLYYASANYVWYDPKTFKPNIDQGMMHAGR